MHVMD